MSLTLLFSAKRSALIGVWFATLTGGNAAFATALDSNLGPYNDSFLEGGVGVERSLSHDVAPLPISGAWSMSGWLKFSRSQPGSVVVAAIGDISEEAWQGIELIDGELAMAQPSQQPVNGAVKLEPQRWYYVALVDDRATARLYLDGREVAARPSSTQSVLPQLALAPAAARTGSRPHFGGSLALWTVSPRVLEAATIASLSLQTPVFSLVNFNAVGVGWPLQEHAWRGLQQPQDPWTLPRANAAPGVPMAVPPPRPSWRTQISTPLAVASWRMSAATSIDASAEQLSDLGFDDSSWYPAVVPGTVLTTLIERGVYPDPDKGLNNLQIPDSLSRQDYWYRSVFPAVANRAGRHVTLTFKGINYAAEIWLNGKRLGEIRGAFTRGHFDITGRLTNGRANALAVKVSPPPHPGIPHEQSIAAGPGGNGGALAIDGPTFIASEGWDWIPGIRDRNAGIWQPVELSTSGDLTMVDPHVITRLPLPRTDSADVSIIVPIDNASRRPLDATLHAKFGTVTVEKHVLLPPGRTEVALQPAEFSQLHLPSPKLWWPNGYGRPDLYRLDLTLGVGKLISDSTSVRFGIRELTYELSLFDAAGRLRRVEVDPTLGSAAGIRLVDGRHEAIKQTPQGWAQSLTPAAERSPAVRDIATAALTPFLVIRVNGVPIAARGGSWGMDDSRKRISRARLGPYFRLHQEAHLNIIRNWLGQNTEDIFYDLADEYGLLVLNDFWISTQDFQLEPQDAALFLANARDTISRYRNHPSIALWFGRNEGVPQPIINEGLADLVAALDGTRLYTGSSNTVNLQGSGPYNYRPPEQYFTTLAQGFSVEVGTPSLSTLESLKASIPAADRWPIGDTYAYHDWHFGGNGDIASYMAAMTQQYGSPSGFEDFERKAQMLDYESYRAIFEGFQSHLWTANSGRLLWMTHPSWPSNTWQIYSSDYDTAAPYYAVKKACESIHAQLDLPNYALTVTNISRVPATGLRLRSQIIAMDNRILEERRDSVDVDANSIVTLPPIALTAQLTSEPLVLVRLTLNDAQGRPVSDNVYWQGLNAGTRARMNGVAPQLIELSAISRRGADGTLVDITLQNTGKAPALATKITVLDAAGERVLPIYYSDNYVTLFPHEARHIEVQCPETSGPCARVAIRGWNVVAAEQNINAAP